MSSRTTRSIVHFDRPFALPGFDGVQPAGDYEVGEDEEMIDGLSFIAWRRVATWLHLPSKSSIVAIQRSIPIDPTELEAALLRDRERTP